MVCSNFETLSKADMQNVGSGIVMEEQELKMEEQIKNLNKTFNGKLLDSQQEN